MAPKSPRDAVIVATGRSAIGRANKGSFVEVRPDDLAAAVVTAVMEKVPELSPAEIDDLILGCAQPAGEQGYNMARVVSGLAGLDSPGVTVNRYCSSSLQSIAMASHAIRAGEGDAFVAAGVECVSRFANGKSDGLPETKNHRMDEAMKRTALRAEGGLGPWSPFAGVPDFYIAMGYTAENVAQIEGVSRQDMDEFAARSQARAVAAQENGVFDAEIIPYQTPGGEVVSRDDCPRAGTTVERLSQLGPVFTPDGRVTAGNACPLNDGAAAVVVMSRERAEQLGLKLLARIVSSAASSLDPEIMGMGPVEASRKALARAGMSIDDVDLVEINEAFAAQVIPSARHLGIDFERLNVHGGAIALGHPFGMTGARIMTTLINALQIHNGTVGLETMCVGGGQGMAMVVEREG